MHEIYMKMALDLAEQAYAMGEVPVGAVITCEGRVVGAAYNQREQLHDPTAHAEMIAITQAAEAIASWRLHHCSLYVTLEPCPMCAGAALNARIPQVIYGAPDPKSGAVNSVFKLLNDARLNHRAEVVQGILQDQCGEILKRFFQKQRKNPHRNGS